jgi:hypothetical protein
MPRLSDTIRRRSALASACALLLLGVAAGRAVPAAAANLSEPPPAPRGSRFT